MITLRSVGKDYKNGPVVHQVLCDVDVEIKDGSFVALMGPSGSGKTTLLNLMGGLDRQTRGTIEVSAHSLGLLSSRQLAQWRSRHIGFVFQSYNLMPGLDAAGNVALPLALASLSSSERKKRANTALEVVGLSAYGSHRPDQLSGGQQQRVAIARAIVTDPTVLLCDEPTGNLDRNAANNILEVLSVLNQQLGKTVVIATHDPLCAERASRLIKLDKGVLQEQAA